MMQRYRSHKLVDAGKIQGISYNAAGEPYRMQVGGRQYDVPNDILIRAPNLGVGDYLVRYADGFLSVSPAAVFEAGYVLDEPPTAAKYEHISTGFRLDESGALKSFRETGGKPAEDDGLPSDVEGAPV